jgi:hypothetical protein
MVATFPIKPKSISDQLTLTVGAVVPIDASQTDGNGHPLGFHDLKQTLL